MPHQPPETILHDFYMGDTVPLEIRRRENLANKDVVITFKARPRDPDVAAKLQVVFNIPDNDKARIGIYRFELTSNQTLLVGTGRVFYDIRIRENLATPVITTIESGKIEVFENITDFGIPTYEPPADFAQSYVDIIDSVLGDTTWRTPNPPIFDADTLDGFDSDYFAVQSETYTKDEVDDLFVNAGNSLTANEILARLITVAGDGSNLDADKLDGLDSDAFALNNDVYTKTEVDQMTGGLGDTVLLIAPSTQGYAGDIYIPNFSSLSQLVLPPAPKPKQSVQINDFFGILGTYNLNIARNGNNIMNLDEDMTVSTSYAKFSLTFINDTIGWAITDK